MADATSDEMPAAGADPDAAARLCERVLARLGGRADGVASAEVGTIALTRFANGRIHQNTSEDARGVRLAVALDGRVAKATTNRTDDAGIAAMVERALAAAALRPVDPDFAGFAPPAPVADVDHWDPRTAAATPDDRADVVAAFVAASQAGREGGPGADAGAAGYCSMQAVAHALASTTGQRAGARRTVAAVDGIHRVTGRSDDPADGCAQAVSARMGDLDGAAIGARAAAKAWSGLDPVELLPGDFEVVFEPRAVSAALLFPVLLGFNGKGHAEGTSIVHLGEMQWDESVDLWDDATDPRALGDPFDAEGTPKRRHDLVRAGASVGLTHDRRSARLAAAAPTGHAVGSDAVGGIATDLFLGGGAQTPDALVAGVERGLLVSDLWYNRVLDPKTQVVTGLTRNGLFLIEEGRVTRPVQNLRYTQSVAAGFGPGRVLGLGADAQLVSERGLTMHVPSVRLAAWSFTGNARG